MLALDSLGNFYKENPTGTLATVASGIVAPYAKSASQFAREYIAFSDGKFGLDIPRQYDDANFDRVSQVGPGAPPTAADENVSVTIAAPGAGGLTNPFSTLNISSISQNGFLVTVVFTGAPLLDVRSFLQSGDVFKVAGVATGGYNGTWNISTILGPKTVTYILSAVTGLAADNTGIVNFPIVDVNVTTVIPATFIIGNSLTISGATDASYNQTYTMRAGPSITGSPNLAYLYSSTFTSQVTSGNGTIAAAGNIIAGLHKISVIFKTRQGYLTAPASPGSWTASGSKRAIITNIPIGPPNVIARIIILTLASGNSFYYLTGVAQVSSSNFIINDNTTTQVTIDFTDAVLAAGTSADYLFKLVELGECAGVIDYASRNWWWGERNKLQNTVNPTFDGGFGTDALGRLYPLGWTEDAVFYPGGADVLTTYPALPVVWGNAYSITGNGVTATRGLITQSAYQDINQVPIIQPNTQYSVRARIARNNLLVQGTVHVHLFSTSASINTTGIQVTAAQATTSYVEFIAVLTVPIATPPSDLVLRVFADGTPTQNGVFLIENIEIFPTGQPFNTSLVRGSRVEDPESYDGVNGIQQYGENDGTRVTTTFKQRNNLYFVKERSLWQTADDGVNEPSKLTVNQVSSTVGTPSVNGVGLGEDWCVIATRQGLYFYDGGEPQKVSQEVQKPVITNAGTLLAGWDNINWQFGHTIYVLVDQLNRRIRVGAPVFGATSPNIEFVMDYRGLDTGFLLKSDTSVHISAYTGKILDIANGRKWTRWNISANSTALIERPDGTAHSFVGNGTGTGKIYDLLDVENFANQAQFSDDGVAINSYYDTYYFLRPEQEQLFQLGSHRKLFHYLTMYMEGQGVPSLFAFPPGNFPAISLPQSGNSLPTLISPLFGANITAISRTNNIVTITCATAHNLLSTSNAVIAGVLNATYNGLFGNLTILNNTSFSFSQNGPNSSSSGGTVQALLRDIEMVVNVLTERCKFRVQTNAVGSWFSLRNLTLSIKTDVWSPVRGIN